MTVKDNSKKLVGQPIFKQLIDFIPKDKFAVLALTHKTDKHYRSFPAWTQLITMLFGIFSRCDSMGEICDGMMGMQGKLNHLGLKSSPARSTAGDGLRERDNVFFEKLYFELLQHFKLFSDIMKGVGRNPKDDGRKKGGLKVHMLIDAHADTPAFVKISEAKCHDKTFIQYLNLPEHSMVVFDRAYNHYLQFAKFTGKKINFVCRLKKNAVYDIIEQTYCKELNDTEYGVLKEEHIHLKYKDNGEEKALCLRKVTYKDEKGRVYEFITNNFEIKREEVAYIYKLRWNIELLFKKLKQNFQLHFFYSETENGIKTQIWCTLIAQLLLLILKVKSETKKAFSTVAALVRIHMISLIDVIWMVENSRRTYVKATKTKNKSPCPQLSIF